MYGLSNSKKTTTSISQDNSKDYYLEENSQLVEYGAGSKVNTSDVILTGGDKGSNSTFNVSVLDGGAIKDSFEFAESTTSKTIAGAVDLATASMDTLRTLTQDALEGTAAAGQRETETAMFALQKANIITGDMPTSTIEKLASYAAIAGVVISVYFIMKGKRNG